MGKIIGIDLGTTNSCVSVIEGGERLLFLTQRVQGNSFCCSIHKDGERMVGAVASVRLLQTGQNNFINQKTYGFNFE
ncbi:MAG: Hsp70 family protein [Eubacterium sp.]